MPTVAVITIVYNEATRLPRWVDYYSRQLGIRACYVVDHGSDDGSTEGIEKAQIIRIPRTAYDNQVRVDAISSFSHFLLKYYDYVIYVDCDEILVADPAEYSGIGDLCNKMQMDYLYSIGIDVVHNVTCEAALRADGFITSQRSFGHFSSAMCKPNLTRQPVKWARGFHSHQSPPKFGPLYNFHLRYVDLDNGLKRQSITRNLEWARDYEGAHHRAPDAEFERLVRAWSKLPVLTTDPMTSSEGVIQGYINDFIAAANRPVGSDYYNVNTFTFGRELIMIPQRFRGHF